MLVYQTWDKLINFVFLNKDKRMVMKKFHFHNYPFSHLLEKMANFGGKHTLASIVKIGLKNYAFQH